MTRIHPSNVERSAAAVEPAARPAEPHLAGPVIRSGVCYAMFAYDIGFSIDLDRAERLIADDTRREKIRKTRRTPPSVKYEPPPVRIVQPAEPLLVGGFSTGPTVEALLYDFGAVSLSYSIPLSGPVSSLVRLSTGLYDNAALLEDSRRRVQQLLDTIRPAVQKPGLYDLVEDYVVFQVNSLEGVDELSRFIESEAHVLAQVLRAEPGTLSDMEVAEALSTRTSFARNDAALIDWNAAVLLDAEADDVRTVLEFVNVYLLEMRVLDQQLDRAMDEAYATLTQSTERRSRLFRSYMHDLRRVARLQADSAVMFEGVSNALKLVGDQYLARVLKAASARLHLPEWDTAILRKLMTLESIYAKITNEQNSRRMELLEWIIIILIAVSILLPFVATH